MYTYTTTLFKVKTTEIDYCVEDEDVIDYVDDPDDDEEIENKIDEIKNGLPQELELEIECDPEDLEDMVCDAISEETGWLVNSFSFDIISQEEIEVVPDFPPDADKFGPGYLD